MEVGKRKHKIWDMVRKSHNHLNRIPKDTVNKKWNQGASWRNRELFKSEEEKGSKIFCENKTPW